MRDIADATMTRNILRTYRQATDAQRHEGMTWYDEAHNLAASLDSDVDRAAGIIAALSPQTPWNRRGRSRSRREGEHDARTVRPDRECLPSCCQARWHLPRADAGRDVGCVARDALELRCGARP